MFYRTIAGVTALTIYLMANGHGMAAGALAVGQPANISKDGVATFIYVEASSSAVAKEKALAGCKGLPNSSETSKALCKVVATFENQCAAQALDPESGTPGFGWALASNSRSAKAQALSNCRDTAGPTRQDKCVVGPKDVRCDGSAK
jgi:hypothetical protein